MARTTVLDPAVNRVLNRRDLSTVVSVPAGVQVSRDMRGDETIIPLSAPVPRGSADRKVAVLISGRGWRFPRVTDWRQDSLVVDAPPEITVPAGSVIGVMRRLVFGLEMARSALESAGATIVLELEVNEGAGWRPSVSFRCLTGPAHATDNRPHRAGQAAPIPFQVTDVLPGVDVRLALAVTGQRRRVGGFIDLED